MNNKQIRLLTQIKELVEKGKCRFKIRNDRNYIEDLLNLGITEDEAWNYILSLNNHFYFIDPKPNYSNTKNSLTFKKIINNKPAYIKVNIDENEVYAEIWSFHEDGR